MQRGSQILAPEVVRVGFARGAQRLQLLAALFDQLVVFRLQSNPRAITHLV
jgi:hypothetical protein